MTDFVASGKRVVEIEQAALTDLGNRIDQAFAEACQLCMSCTGKIVVSGMGKSGQGGNFMGKYGQWG